VAAKNLLDLVVYIFATFATFDLSAAFVPSLSAPWRKRSPFVVVGTGYGPVVPTPCLLAKIDLAIMTATTCLDLSRLT
jgi:hypothetical protein